MVLDKKQNKDITIYAVETFKPVRIKNIIYLEWYVIFEDDYKKKLKEYGFK